MHPNNRKARNRRIGAAPPNYADLAALVSALSLAIEKAGSQARLADAVGVGQSTVSRWQVVPEQYLHKISSVTGLPFYTLRPDLFDERGQVRGSLTVDRKSTSPRAPSASVSTSLLDRMTAERDSLASRIATLKTELVEAEKGLEVLNGAIAQLQPPSD